MVYADSRTFPHSSSYKGLAVDAWQSQRAGLEEKCVGRFKLDGSSLAAACRSTESQHSQAAVPVATVTGPKTACASQASQRQAALSAPTRSPPVRLKSTFGQLGCPVGSQVHLGGMPAGSAGAVPSSETESSLIMQGGHQAASSTICSRQQLQQWLPSSQVLCNPNTCSSRDLSKSCCQKKVGQWQAHSGVIPFLIVLSPLMLFIRRDWLCSQLCSKPGGHAEIHRTIALLYMSAKLGTTR